MKDLVHRVLAEDAEDWILYHDNAPRLSHRTFGSSRNIHAATTILPQLGSQGLFFLAQLQGRLETTASQLVQDEVPQQCSRYRGTMNIGEKILTEVMPEGIILKNL